MDNLAHTLAGAALGQAGLKRRTGLGMATLMIAANLPDLDGITMLTGRSLIWRRGWTHGPISMVLMPVLLTAVMLLFDRWQARRGTRPADRLPVRPGWVLVLAGIGMLSHVLMDLLNTYGVRCLMPFADRWFYGDMLFIVDVWLWSMLAIGIWLSRRRERRGGARAARPALVALILTTAYVGAMGVAGRAAERYATQQIVAQGLPVPTRVLASPVPIDPFRRQILFEVGDAYGFGDVRWTPGPHFTRAPGLVPTNMGDPAIARARAQDTAVADFLYWSRFPFATVRKDAKGTEVVIGDARYNQNLGGSQFVVRSRVAGK
ncbi:metal-dependent hydrolase [Sphingobium sufflavum]|uniref:metal-dependent hydrolase n=1 Tax=Sphingobium sufflavum TaxID=1129547 RepID=UPI001F2B5829|nr:metal-dependent hydrolase [Sphingobium sufflavum]MCE7796180.1 metal-dependent hydrolase [Sphingobium sufflavum]